MTEDGVRPFLKPEQNTLILRDIPSSTPSEEVISIFSQVAECPPVQSVRSEMNDNW